MYAQLGKIIFQNLRGFDAFGRTGSVTYAEHKPLTGKPRLQPTGSNLDEISISMRFHISFCNPAQELNTLKKSRDNNEILPLLSAQGSRQGDFVITDINEVVEDADIDGRVFSYRVTCTLKEFVAQDRLQAEQNEKRENAAAVGNKKPVAKKKTNPSTCAQTISGLVTQISTHSKVIHRIVDQQGGANTPMNRLTIQQNLDAIFKCTLDLVKECNDAKSCAYNNADLITNTLQVQNNISSFKFNLNLFAIHLIPAEDKKLVASAEKLKTAARPFLTKSMTGGK